MPSWTSFDIPWRYRGTALRTPASGILLPAHQSLLASRATRHSLFSLAISITWPSPITRRRIGYVLWSEELLNVSFLLFFSFAFCSLFFSWPLALPVYFFPPSVASIFLTFCISSAYSRYSCTYIFSSSSLLLFIVFLYFSYIYSPSTLCDAVSRGAIYESRKVPQENDTSEG